MLLTPDFVFLNNPRTGTTFARKAIKAAYASISPDGMPFGAGAVEELLLPIDRGLGREGRDHHGTYSQIPETHRGLPVVSAVRNPFTLLVSVYELRLWASAPLPRGVTRADYPMFPNLTFDEFLQLQQLKVSQRWALPINSRGVGPLSAHFLQMFARRPTAAIDDVRRAAPERRIEAHIPEIVFLRQERLREELCGLLRSVRSKVRVAEVEALAATHVTKRSQAWRHSSFNVETVTQILEREAFLFGALARRGIVYTFENADFVQFGDSRKEAAEDGAG
jgi:hypothetical protein